MARPDPHGRGHRHHDKHAGARGVAGQDQEEEGQDQEKAESDLERAQNRLGNAALSAMLGATSDGGGEGGGGGLGMRARAADQEKERPSHGGEADPVDDGVITLEDLTRSWNPRLKKDKERPAFRESMPDDDLPPEDADFLQAVRALPRPQLGEEPTVDGLLQPSADALQVGLTPWIRQVAPWASESVAHRLLIRVLAPPAPCLQDPFGRVSLARARAGAAAVALLLDTPLLSRPEPLEAALVQLCLEIGGSTRLAAEVQSWAEEHGGDLPEAAATFRSVLELDDLRPARPVEVDLPPGTLGRIALAIHQLADLPSAARALPSLPDPSPTLDEEDDDPLGLDAIIAQHTGEGLDPQASLYQTCVQSAERLAAQIARTRVRIAAVAAAIANVARHWSAGPPHAHLLQTLHQLDQASMRTLQLLVEIARAAQRHAVAVRGIQNGLKRAARAIDEHVRTSVIGLAQVAASVLPGVPDLPPPPEPPQDALQLLLDEDRPGEALALLQSQGSADAQAATALLRVFMAEPPASLMEPLAQAAERARSVDRPWLATALDVFLGSCALWTGELERAEALARQQVELGRQRRNGMLVAVGVLLAMEAALARGDAEQAHVLRRDGGALAWHMGAQGALSLLARWRPPDDDLTDDATPTAPPEAADTHQQAPNRADG